MKYLMIAAVGVLLSGCADDDGRSLLQRTLANTIYTS